MFSTKENKGGPDVKAQKAKARKETERKKKHAAHMKKHYHFLKENDPDKLQMRACKKRIKCLEDTVYGENIAQQKRTNDAKYRTTSKNFATVSGTRGKWISPEGRTLVESRCIAWKGSHSTMRGFYTELVQENHACLKGYDRQRLEKICERNKFSSLPVLEQMDNAEETSETILERFETILESGMIEDQVMPALPPLPSVAVTNAYAHISVVQI